MIRRCFFLASAVALVGCGDPGLVIALDDQDNSTLTLAVCAIDTAPPCPLGTNTSTATSTSTSTNGIAVFDTPSSDFRLEVAKAGATAGSSMFVYYRIDGTKRPIKMTLHVNGMVTYECAPQSACSAYTP